MKKNVFFLVFGLILGITIAMIGNFFNRPPLTDGVYAIKGAHVLALSGAETIWKINTVMDAIKEKRIPKEFKLGIIETYSNNGHINVDGSSNGDRYGIMVILGKWSSPDQIEKGYYFGENSVPMPTNEGARTSCVQRAAAKLADQLPAK